jgi:hypothetical protein
MGVAGAGALGGGRPLDEGVGSSWVATVAPEFRSWWTLAHLQDWLATLPRAASFDATGTALERPGGAIGPCGPSELRMAVDTTRGSGGARCRLRRGANGSRHHGASLPTVHGEGEQVRAAVVAGSVEVVSSAGHVVEVEVGNQ